MHFFCRRGRARKGGGVSPWELRGDVSSDLLPRVSPQNSESRATCVAVDSRAEIAPDPEWVVASDPKKKKPAPGFRRNEKFLGLPGGKKKRVLPQDEYRKLRQDVANYDTNEADATMKGPYAI